MGFFFFFLSFFSEKSFPFCVKKSALKPRSFGGGKAAKKENFQVISLQFRGI